FFCSTCSPILSSSASRSWGWRTRRTADERQAKLEKGTMRIRANGGRLWIWISILGPWLMWGTLLHGGEAARTGEDVLSTAGETGQRGGRLVASLHSDPRTLNPVTALDANSKQIIGLLFADLIHINPYTEKTEASLAKSWRASLDGRRYILELRRGIRF